MQQLRGIISSHPLHTLTRTLAILVSMSWESRSPLTQYTLVTSHRQRMFKKRARKNSSSARRREEEDEPEEDESKKEDEGRKETMEEPKGPHFSV